MADKFHSDTQEKIELILYNPSYPTTGDLEAGTKAIAATSEASGIGNADYSAALTLPSPSDARLVVLRIVSRLSVNIDSFDVATTLYCRVYVDAQDADHRLFDLSWSSTGENLAAVDETTGTIFDLLSDGSSHTLYFFFWIDQANAAVISAVSLQLQVGTSSTSFVKVMAIIHSGLITLSFRLDRRGTGSMQGRFLEKDSGNWNTGANLIISGTGSQVYNPTPAPAILVKKGIDVYLYGTVATDGAGVTMIFVTLRSEQ